MFGIQHITPAVHLSTPVSSPMVFFISFTNVKVSSTFMRTYETESLQFKKLDFLLPSKHGLILVSQKILAELSQTLEGAKLVQNFSVIL